MQIIEENNRITSDADESCRENLKNNAIDVNTKGRQGREAIKAKGSKHGNVIGTAIITDDPLDNVPALMHILMGLLNDTLDEMHKDIQFEDKNNEGNITVDEEKVIKLEKLEQDLTGFKEEFTE